MRIAGAEILDVGGALTRPIANARGEWRERRGLLLRLRDDQGRIGQGEASPLPGYSPDTIEEARAALHGVTTDIGTRIEIDTAGAPAEQIARVVNTISRSVPSARFALETALFDLAGQQLGLPLHALLGGAPAREPDGITPPARELARNAPQRPLPGDALPRPLAGDPPPRPLVGDEPEGARRVALAALITGGTTAELVAAAVAAERRGIRTMKVKLGRDYRLGGEGLEQLLALRRAVGHGVAVRLDANGAFTAQIARRVLNEVRAIDPELVEEPVEDGGMRRLRSSPVRLAADESLQREGGFEALRELLESGTCCAVVLKPTALGGLLRCMELATAARRFDAQPIVTHTFDGPIALAAAAALALALDSPFACGLDRHAALAAYPSCALPFLDENSIVASNAPGLGIELVDPGPGARLAEAE